MNHQSDCTEGANWRLGLPLGRAGRGGDVVTASSNLRPSNKATDDHGI